MSNNVMEMLQAIVGELKSMARSETIIGDPVTLGDKTVVPVAKISIGFGAGGGQGTDDKNQTGFGGGGGAGATIQPAAFIVIDGDKVSLLPAGKGKFDQIIEAVPDLLNKIKKMMPEKKKSGGSDDDSA